MCASHPTLISKYLGVIYAIIIMRFSYLTLIRKYVRLILAYFCIFYLVLIALCFIYKHCTLLINRVLIPFEKFLSLRCPIFSHKTLRSYFSHKINVWYKNSSKHGKWIFWHKLQFEFLQMVLLIYFESIADKNFHQTCSWT